MNVAVIGSGCIGLYVGGLLSTVSGVHTRIVGRERIRKDIEEEKQLIITNENGKTELNSSQLNLVTEINDETMSDRDIILIAVKSFDTKSVAESLTRCNLKKGCTVISLQNSVKNAEILREVFVKHYLAVKMAKKRDPTLETPDVLVLGGMVPFNIIWKSRNHLHMSTKSFPLTIEQIHDPSRQDSLFQLKQSLEKSGIPINFTDNIEGILWSKLLSLNVGNAVNALSGVSVYETLYDSDFRRIIYSVMGEGLEVAKAENVLLERVGNAHPYVNFPCLLLPTWMFMFMLNFILKMDRYGRSSMLEDVLNKRQTEIDYLNGVIVELGKKHGIATPVNERIVKLIKESPRKYSGKELRELVKADESGVESELMYIILCWFLFILVLLSVFTF